MVLINKESIFLSKNKHCTIIFYILVDLGGPRNDTIFFFIFMWSSAKLLPNNRRLAPPLGLAPSMGNPGATSVNEGDPSDICVFPVHWVCHWKAANIRAKKKNPVSLRSPFS